MNKPMIALVISFIAFAVAVAQAESQPQQPRYPNELPNLKLYQDARWNALKPYISTIDDGVKLLGEPVRVFDYRLQRYDWGYDDPDWTIFVDVLGSDPDLTDAVRGRVLHVYVNPKKCISLVGADFSAFKSDSSTYSRDPSVGGTVYAMIYYDKFGLRYSVYAKDTPDGRFHAGDLASIIYGPSDEETARYRRSRPTTPN
jgi:hypothetical protein